VHDGWTTITSFRSYLLSDLKGPALKDNVMSGGGDASWRCSRPVTTLEIPQRGDITLLTQSPVTNEIIQK